MTQLDKSIDIFLISGFAKCTCLVIDKENYTAHLSVYKDCLVPRMMSNLELKNRAKNIFLSLDREHPSLNKFDISLHVGLHGSSKDVASSLWLNEAVEQSQLFINNADIKCNPIPISKLLAIGNDLPAQCIIVKASSSGCAYSVSEHDLESPTYMAGADGPFSPSDGGRYSIGQAWLKRTAWPYDTDNDHNSREFRRWIWEQPSLHELYLAVTSISNIPLSVSDKQYEATSIIANCAIDLSRQVKLAHISLLNASRERTLPFDTPIFYYGSLLDSCPLYADTFFRNINIEPLFLPPERLRNRALFGFLILLYGKERAVRLRDALPHNKCCFEINPE